MQESGQKNQEAGSLQILQRSICQSVLTKHAVFEETPLLRYSLLKASLPLVSPIQRRNILGQRENQIYLRIGFLILPSPAVSALIPALDPQLAIGQHLETQQTNLNFPVEVPDHYK